MTTLYKIHHDSALYKRFLQPPRIIHMCDWLLHASGTTRLVCGRKAYSLLASTRVNAGKLVGIFLTLEAEKTPQGQREKIGPRPIFQPCDNRSPFCFKALATPAALAFKPCDVNNQNQLLIQHMAAEAWAMDGVDAIVNYLRSTSKFTALTRMCSRAWFRLR